MPRTPVMTDVNQQIVCAIVAAGGTLEAAACYIGCTRRTVAAEARRNPQFRDALKQAEIDGTLALLRDFNRAARRSWRASKWWLEQRFPERFASR